MTHDQRDHVAAGDPPLLARMTILSDVVTVVVGAVATATLGTGAALLTARSTPRPPVFLGAGIAAGAIAAATVASVAARRRPDRTRRTTVAVVAVVVMAGGWLLPLPGTARSINDPSINPTAVQYWQLSTGSRIAFNRIPARGGFHHRSPVVVLHGGPGIPDSPSNRAFWGQLAADGFDVYLYAQVGAGLSSRLDPEAYSLDRDVADLEQIRVQLHATRLILIGHSYGGVLAAGYLAVHPDHVARLILSSPGPLDPADHSGDHATQRLSATERLRTYALALAPRALLAYLLLQSNPTAAYEYLPDHEADQYNDRILTAADPALHCRGATPTPVTGSGFYRLQYPQSAAADPQPDLRPDLAKLPTPALLFKGGCDYLSWNAAEDYRRVLRSTKLIYLPGAGHNTYQDQPDTVLAVSRAFLSDRPLPVPTYDATEPPPDYQRAR